MVYPILSIFNSSECGFILYTAEVLNIFPYGNIT